MFDEFVYKHRHLYTHVYFLSISHRRKQNETSVFVFVRPLCFLSTLFSGCACACCAHVLSMSLSAGDQGSASPLLGSGGTRLQHPGLCWVIGLSNHVSWQKGAVLWQQIEPGRFPCRCGADGRLIHTPAKSPGFEGYKAYSPLPLTNNFPDAIS